MCIVQKKKQARSDSRNRGERMLSELIQCDRNSVRQEELGLGYVVYGMLNTLRIQVL